MMKKPKSNLGKYDPKVNVVMNRLFENLNQLNNVDVTNTARNDMPPPPPRPPRPPPSAPYVAAPPPSAVAPPPSEAAPPPQQPRFCIDFSMYFKDNEAPKQKHNVVDPPAVADPPAVVHNDYLKNLGFEGDCENGQMFIRDKSVALTAKSLRDVGRTWFKTDFTDINNPKELDWMVSLHETVKASNDLIIEARHAGKNYKEKLDDDLADIFVPKERFKDHIKEVKRQERAKKKAEKMAKKKGKKRAAVNVGSTSGARRGRKKRKVT